MMGGAAVFKESSGDEVTYALSHQVDTIDVFISHNWCVSRVEKLVALSFHFHLWPAALGTFIVLTLLVVLSAAGELPTVRVLWSPYLRGLACKSCAIPVFLLLLFLYSDLKRWLGRCLGIKGPVVFLDKTCIHQTDQDIQRQGIAKLGAFLCNSKHMVVLYTDAYLTRLWTVYEFACFLTLHPVRDMMLVPVTITMRSLQALLIIMFGFPLVTGIELYSGFFYTVEMSYIVLAPLLVTVFRWEAHDRASLRKHITEFTVRKCMCACEEDRPLVYHNVAELMRAARVVPTSAPEEDALDAFDMIARAKLPRLVAAATGRCGFRYRDLLVWSGAVIIPYWMDKWVSAFHGMPWEEVVADGVQSTSLIFVITPLTFSLCAKAADRFLNVHWLCEIVFICTLGWAGLIVFALNWIPVLTLVNASGFEQEANSHWALWAALVIMSAQSAVVFRQFGLYDYMAKSKRMSTLAPANMFTAQMWESDDQNPGMTEKEFSDPSLWEHLSMGVGPSLSSSRSVTGRLTPMVFGRAFSLRRTCSSPGML